MAGNQLAPAGFPSQEQPESAPSSADFYFEQVVSTNSPTDATFEIFDPTYTSEWLPSLSELSSDINYLVDGRRSGTPRLELVIEYVDWLRSRIEPESFDGDRAYAKAQTGPRLFLDCLSLVSRHQKYQSDSSRVGRRSPETFQDLLEILELKRNMKNDIASYVRLRPNTQHDVMFNNLLSMMNHARRVAFNDEVSTNTSIESNRRYILGLLAENKVVDALQYDRWPLTSHASAQLDSAGFDAIVPVDINPRTAVGLQVKSSLALGGMFEIKSEGNRTLIVVPQNPITNDPFNLDRAHARALNSYIYRAPRMRLPLAA